MPLRTTAMSVVVPPMSAMMAFWVPASAHAPSTLAAGPDSTVATGRCSALCTLTKLPSPLTTISGAWIPRSLSVARTDSIMRCTKGIIRAFSAVVRARRGAPKLLASSWPQVTGLSHSSRTQARSCISWARLRTAKVPEMANALTRLTWAWMAALAAASSNAHRACPAASCPPAKETIASWPNSSIKPLALICRSS